MTWPQVVPWIGIPLMFATFGSVTYWIVDAKVVTGFFPDQAYWLVAIAVHVALGLTLCLALYGSARKMLVLGYVIAMTAVLPIVQGTVSCFAGDCL